MTDREPSSPRYAGRIKDARGRKVTQLDPVALYLLRRHDVIEADTLRAIANEKGVRITTGERAALISGVCGAVLVVGIFFTEALRGGLHDAPYAKFSGLLYLCSLPWIIWYGIKRKRFSNVAAAMLKHVRCPHCGYDLRFLPADQADEATVCPECGCAWQLVDEPTTLEQGPL
jgi:hypothetical protein